MVRGILAAAAVALVFFGFACTGSDTPPPFTSTTDAGSEPTDATTPELDGSKAGDPDGGVTPGPSCARGCADAGGAPSCLVVLPNGTYCIDETEVTQEAYGIFFTNAQNNAQPAGDHCPPGGVTVQQPVGGLSAPTLPVNGVTICEAKAYCLSVGKHLCGKIGGGRLAIQNDFRSMSSEWRMACLGGTTPTNPTNGTCNLGGTQIAPVKTTCEGPVPGLYDMLGNVWEWVDARSNNDDDPASDDGTSLFVGGNYGSPKDTPCDQVSSVGIDTALPGVGFRCCATP